MMHPPLAPTPRDVLMRDGASSLLRFVGRSGPHEEPDERPPLLLVPSMINRWYVLDLREGVSFASAMVDAGLDTFCLDWGVSGDEDRHLEWDDVLARLARAVSRVKRETGASKVSLLGYCMGGTLAAIHTAMHPDEVAGLVNLAGPIDFARGGALRAMVDPRWFDPEALAAPGNIASLQMQAGFWNLRPTSQVAKWIGLADRTGDADASGAFWALETWASDNVPFPAAAYVRYIRELYQDNALYEGRHRIRGRAVDLADIRCPILAVVANRDTICPPPAAAALCDACPDADSSVLEIPGGHVGAVVGSKAPRVLYPAVADWLKERTWN